FRKQIESTETIMPLPKSLPRSKIVAPHIVVADKGYGLTATVLKPFMGSYLKLTESQQLFNRKLSVARRFVEQAFGQLVAQFDVLKDPIYIIDEHKIDLIILSCCVLHNMLIDRETRTHGQLSGQTKQ